MRAFFSTILFLVIGSGYAQQALPMNPWESVAPGGSEIYTDLKEAGKNASSVYRMELSGQEVFLDKKFASRIVRMTSLMALRIANNGLTEFPGSLLSLRALVYFSSRGNKFTTLPDSLGLWGSLRFLELHQAAFDTVPEGIYGIPRLQSLTFNSNTDTLRFTGALKYCSKRLVELKIYNCLFDTLPEEFGQLTALTKLVLYKCKLNEIPDPVYQLDGLSELWLDSNNLATLPSSIALMQNLTYLSLRGNRITKITSSICFLSKLVVLDLRGNPLDPYDVRVVEALLPNTRVLF